MLKRWVVALVMGLVFLPHISPAASIDRFADATLISRAELCVIPSEKLWSHVQHCDSFTEALGEVAFLHVHSDFAQIAVLPEVDPLSLTLILRVSDRGGSHWSLLTPATLTKWAPMDDVYFASWPEGKLEPGGFLRVTLERSGEVWEDEVVYLLD